MTCESVQSNRHLIGKKTNFLSLDQVGQGMVTAALCFFMLFCPLPYCALNFLLEYMGRENPPSWSCQLFYRYK